MLPQSNWSLHKAASGPHVAVPAGVVEMADGGLDKGRGCHESLKETCDRQQHAVLAMTLYQRGADRPLVLIGDEHKWPSPIGEMQHWE